MNELMKWAQSQEQAEAFSREKLTRVPLSEDAPEIEVPSFLKTPSANKLLTLQFPDSLSPEGEHSPAKSTMIGGMCLLTTIDMKKISRRETTFDSIEDFDQWYSSWYPRIDQVHDAVGTPPKACSSVLYVSEDSFFADRLSKYTGLDKDGLQSVLRNVHEEQGQPTLERYLRSQGYKGKVTPVYTSDIESELDLALNMWERTMGKKFKTADRNFAKVELMYTGYWLDILGVQDSGVIFEAANKMVLKGYLKLEDWFREQGYGTGVNRNLGIAGYLPFLSTKGDSSVIGYEEVPNFGNFIEHQIPDEEMPWYITNLLFAKKRVVDEGPLAISNSDAQDMITNDLSQYYQK